ncbi:hypothetical protein JHK82_046219 [Glycine max]|nr:hypothetical protein JHK82_046219 [Glycine max]
MVSCEEKYGEKLTLVQPDPVALEINRLQNQLKEKDKELATCQGEMKALRSTEALKDKAIEELRNGASKLDERLRVTEDHLKQKNLEIKKLTDEKKDALASQYAAEATLRRVHANQKDEDFVPIESVIAPLEAEIKMYRNEITALQEDKKALEQLTKSKESALLEAERILRSALERALVVEEVEKKLLEKNHRQKILEVEKLSKTIQQLEEVILASGATANAVRDCQRQISELQEEKRTLERELARVKVSANRIANVVANEWKDENDKVMPVRQWLEERRIMQLGSPTKKYGSTENMLKKGMWALRSKVANNGEKENEMQVKTDMTLNRYTDESEATEIKTIVNLDEDAESKKPNGSSRDDVVSGFLYDKLQKEVINLRKSCEIKDSSLLAKDEEIKMLIKKVDVLTKAMEVEWKKMKREAAAREKEASSTKSDDNRKKRSGNSSKRFFNFTFCSVANNC